MNCPIAISSVRPLFLIGRPLAIFFAVPEIIVNSLNGISRAIGRFKSHIFNEVFEGIKPSVEDCYSASTVVSKSFVVWISASLDDLSPAEVFRCLAHIVSGRSFGCSLSIETATAFRPAAPYLSSFCHYLCPTITNENPKSSSVLYTIEINRLQPIESSSRNILEIPRTLAVNRIRHKSNFGWLMFRAYRRVMIGDWLAFNPSKLICCVNQF